MARGWESLVFGKGDIVEVESIARSIYVWPIARFHRQKKLDDSLVHKVGFSIFNHTDASRRIPGAVGQAYQSEIRGA